MSWFSSSAGGEGAALSWITIDSDEKLRGCMPDWLRCDAVAIDTEFMRQRTYYAIPALLQLSDGERHYLVDLLRVRDPAPLGELLGDATTLKVLHACGEDLQVFERLLPGIVVAPLFDTQLAAMLCSFEAEPVAYKHLVQRHCAVELGKSETRSDWLRRPLSEAQCRYAIEDVVHLLPLYRILRSELERLGRVSWCASEHQRLRRPPDDLQLPLGRATRRKLRNPALLPVLRRLCEWREDMARERDLPRQWLVEDAVLLALARANPQTAAALAEVAGLSPKLRRRNGDELLELLRCAAADPVPERVPLALSERAGATSAETQQLEALAEAAKAVAEAFGLGLDFLCPRRDRLRLVDAASAGEELPLAEIGEWRRELLADALRELCPRWG